MIHFTYNFEWWHLLYVAALAFEIGIWFRIGKWCGDRLAGWVDRVEAERALKRAQAEAEDAWKSVDPESPLGKLRENVAQMGIQIGEAFTKAPKQ